MTRILEGKPSGKGLRVGLVVSRFNSFVTDKLLEGALSALQASGVTAEDIAVVRVPGSFEIPLAAQRLASSGRFHGIVCLGAIIKGETPHWDYLSQAVSFALAQAALQADVPFSFGVLTTEDREAALARAGARGDNKGYDAAMAVVEMAHLFHQLDEAGTEGVVG
jgi:6,7-dimethyl-8-ribityllumazine synthase